MKAYNDRVFISQYGNTERNAPTGPGTVYVYNHEGEYIMNIESPEPEELAVFGFSVSVSDKYIVIGEPWATVDEVFRAGKVHIYDSNGVYLRSIQSPLPDTTAWFGNEVEVVGETVIICEPAADIEPFRYEGKVYIYNIDGELLQTLTAPDPTPRGAFGFSIDVEGDLLAISEAWAEVDGKDDCGKVYLYKLGASVEVQEPVQETTTETIETETESNRGIPGYPFWSIALSLILITIILSYNKRLTTLLSTVIQL